MNETELLPTTGVTGDPAAMSTLMELDPNLTDEILDLVCGLEQYKNLRLHRQRLFSLSFEQEPMVNTVTRFIDALIRFMQRFFKDVYEGSATLSFALGKIHNRAELINTNSRSRARTNRDGEFKIDTRINNLCVNYRPVSDPQQLLMFTKTNDQLFKAYFRYQNLELPQIIPSITAIKPTEPDSVLRLIELLTPVSPMVKASSLGIMGDETSKVSPHLFGNQRLFAINRDQSNDPVEFLAGQEWLIQPSSDNPKSPPTSITYKVFASTIEQSILRQVIATTTDIESNFSIVTRNRRAIRLNDFTKYLELLRNNLVTNTYSGEALERANQIVRLLEAYSNWLINPYLNLMGLYIRNANAALNVCAANN